MDFDLERQIRLSEESEFKSLYKWSLQETDESGETIGRDLIPWQWTLTFTAKALCYHWSTKGEPDDEDDSSETLSVTDNERISGTLRPGFSKDGVWEDETRYSMFGTGRRIKLFDLHIEKLKKDDAIEGCRVWGIPRYTSEIDFKDETQDDVIQITLYLSADRFDRLAETIKAQQADTATLYLSGVSGLYSEWSPSISTNSVKVLAAGREQEVAGTESAAVNPPRLGKVGEFELGILRSGALGFTTTRMAVDADRLLDNDGSEWADELTESDPGIGEALKGFLDEDLLKLPENKAHSWSSQSQFNAIAQQVAESIARYSISRSENVSRFKSRLDDAYGILTSIRDATNQDTRYDRAAEEKSEEKKAERKKAEHTIWYHGEALFAFHAGYESEYARKVEVDCLQQEARKYLLRPWMENETLEWIIVDALAFSTVNKFGEELKQQAPAPFSFLGVSMAYFSAKGNVMKMFWKRMQYGLTKLGIFLGAPIALGWYFWNRERQDEVAIAGAAYGAILVLYLTYRLLRWAFGKKPKTLYDKYEALWPDMVAIYDMLRGEVVSPTQVRDRFLDTARRGAYWPGAIYAVLDNAIQRNPAVWGATESDRYRYNEFF